MAFEFVLNWNVTVILNYSPNQYSPNHSPRSFHPLDVPHNYRLWLTVQRMRKLLVPWLECNLVQVLPEYERILDSRAFSRFSNFMIRLSYFYIISKTLRRALMFTFDALLIPWELCIDWVAVFCFITMSTIRNLSGCLPTVVSWGWPIREEGAVLKGL